MQTTQDTTFAEVIEREHIRVVHLFDRYHPYGGCTIAYRPERHDATGYPIGKFARVAVTYCHPQYRYSRKLGRTLAVENLLSGENILMPLYVNKTPVKDLQMIFTGVLGANLQ